MALRPRLTTGLPLSVWEWCPISVIGRRAVEPQSASEPGARHHFDGAELRKLTIVADARGGRGATMDYDPAAHEDAEKQVRVFLAAHLGK